MPPPEGETEGGGSQLRKGMDGRQPRGKWNAGNIWNRLGLGEMAALWLVPPRQLPEVHPLSDIVSGLAEHCPAFCNLHASS